MCLVCFVNSLGMLILTLRLDRFQCLRHQPGDDYHDPARSESRLLCLNPGARLRSRAPLLRAPCAPFASGARRAAGETAQMRPLLFSTRRHRDRELHRRHHRHGQPGRHRGVAERLQVRRRPHPTSFAYRPLFSLLAPAESALHSAACLPHSPDSVPTFGAGPGANGGATERAAERQRRRVRRRDLARA